MKNITRKIMALVLCVVLFVSFSSVAFASSSPVLIDEGNDPDCYYRTYEFLPDPYKLNSSVPLPLVDHTNSDGFYWKVPAGQDFFVSVNFTDNVKCIFTIYKRVGNSTKLFTSQVDNWEGDNHQYWLPPQTSYAEYYVTMKQSKNTYVTGYEGLICD